MIPSKEMLMAYADGELSAEEARRIEAALGERADLRAFVEQQRALRKAMNDALSPVLAMPVPERLNAAVAGTSPSWRWRLRNGAFSRAFIIRSAIPTAAALACGLIIGIAVERGYLASPGNIPGTQASAVVAQGALAEALSTRLAADGVSNAGIRVAVSFRSRDGRDCRTFEDRHAGQAGIACRDPQAWSIAMLVPAPELRQPSAYHMAGSAMPDSVRNAIQGMIAGDPFDAAREQDARVHGWTAR